jgi:hypothetical protein
VTEIPDDEVDPKVAELVVTIRDRFGLRGLRGARWMIDKEIAIADERAVLAGTLTPGRAAGRCCRRDALPRLLA